MKGSRNRTRFQPLWKPVLGSHLYFPAVMWVCSNQSLFIVVIWRDQKSIETSKKDPMREIGRKSLQI